MGMNFLCDTDNTSAHVETGLVAPTEIPLPDPDELACSDWDLQSCYSGPGDSPQSSSMDLASERSSSPIHLSDSDPDVAISCGTELDNLSSLQSDETPFGISTLAPCVPVAESSTTHTSSAPRLFSIFAKGAAWTAQDSSKAGSKKRKREEEAKEAMRKKVFKPEMSKSAGTSKSAIHERESRQAHTAGTFVISSTREANWHTEIRTIDRRAKFQPGDVMQVRCSKCKKSVKVSKLYGTTRFRQHYVKCKGQDQTTMSDMEEDFAVPFKPAKTLVDKGRVISNCPGIAAKDDKRILGYLARSPAAGGGGRDFGHWAEKRYNRKYEDLNTEERIQIRIDQVDSHRWRNDYRLGRIYSKRCAGEVSHSATSAPPSCQLCKALLSDRDLNRLLDKPEPDAQNSKFNNHWIQDNNSGEKYLKIKGLSGLLNSETPQSPYLRYALGVMNGTYKDPAILSGMLEAHMMRADRDREGKGMQNFQWNKAAEYDRLLHVLYIESPKAYRELSKHLPARSIRSFQ